jgi:hypothetical protein
MAIIAALLLGGIGALVAINRASEQASKSSTVKAVEHDHNGDGVADHSSH